MKTTMLKNLVSRNGLGHMINTSSSIRLWKTGIQVVSVRHYAPPTVRVARKVIEEVEDSEYSREVMSLVPDDLRVGFLGAGKMSQALSQRNGGLVSTGLVKAENILASDRHKGVLKAMQENGIRTTADNKEIVEKSSVVVIAVKPHIVPEVLHEVAPLANKNKLFVSIAAGVTIDSIEKLLPPETPVIRVMPNTPSLVQCGASVFSPGTHATPEHSELVLKLFSSIGICFKLPEKNLDAVTGLSGSGPAYGFLAIEALSDGGVRMGLPRDVATKLAAQTLMGAAKMVLETGKHPGELKDAVCSPGGTTIAAVHSLERGSFRATLLDAVMSATDKARELGGAKS